MKIVGVTCCIAGLAHTPMAAKALEKAGSKLEYDVKIEQQGAMGQINALTEEDVKEADFVLISADQAIKGMERFNGKIIIRVPLGTVIKNAEAVLKKCVEKVSSAK